ncbi:MAG TPA: WecB/TagA/CpsF family glycosyltransferase [Candidatus Cybelea sp.]|nr:WecB/TagA/CpsF family glycosyltransferase [Candidatus Cybelea sp.]
MSSLQILGCRLDPIDADEAAENILNLARGRNGAQVVTLGTEMVVYAQKNAEFRTIVNRSALSLCDTAGILTVARWRGAHLRDRVAGVELLEHLCEGAAAAELPVYFLGGAPGVAADAAAILEVRFPGLQIAGTRDGYFKNDETSQVVGEIAASGARLLFVGLGSPRQEFWLAEHLAETGCGVGIGVGGSFDVISGRIARAPQIVQRMRLEWLYRLMKEPRRWRRQLALPHFAALVALDRLRP